MLILRRGMMTDPQNFDEEFEFISQSPTRDTCPYCGVKLEKIPTRKKKCPKCGNNIFVSQSMLYTEEEKNIIDYLIRYPEEYWGITRKRFNETRERLNLQFGAAASVKDTFEHILYDINTQRISETIAEWEKAKTIRYVRWNTTNDDLVCDLCRVRNGKQFLLSEAENLIPAHLGCRCWLSPIVDEDLVQERLENTLSGLFDDD
jgi:SPP1 gp7 family putative phage head morphogenesis protein